jgi:hypothetical protein
MGTYNYSQLLDVKIKHDFYQTGISNDIDFLIPASVQSKLQGQRLLLKSYGTGITILYQDLGGNTPIVPIDNNLFFYAGLRLKEPDYFLGISNLDQVVPSAVSYNGSKKICFKNNGLNSTLNYSLIDGIEASVFNFSTAIAGNPPSVLLKIKDNANADVTASFDINGVEIPGPYILQNSENIFQFKPNFLKAGNGFYQFIIRDAMDTTTLAQFEYLVHDELCTQALSGVLFVNYPASAAPLLNKVFDMNFSRKKTQWKIYVGIKNKDALNLSSKDLVVIDLSDDDHTNPNQTTPYDTYTFSGNPTGISPSDQADPDPANSIGDLDTLVFTSTQNIPFYEIAKIGLKLKLIDEPNPPDAAGKLLIENIKNPDPRMQSGNISNIYVYI